MQIAWLRGAHGTPRPVAVAAVCAIGLACVMFDQTSLVVAVATIGRDLDAGLAGMQWLSAIMPMVAASALPTSGVLASHYGARTILRTGLLVFACGAAAAASSTAMPMLLAARVVQGVGVAMVLPNCPTLLAGNVPAGPARQRAVGYLLVIGCVGLLLGPIVGGVLVEALGWRVTFVALVPVTLIGALAAGLLSETARAGAGRLDLAGMVTAALLLATLTWALIETGRESSSPALVLTGYTLSAGLVAAFVRIERRAANPLLDMSLLRMPHLRILLPATFGYNAMVNGSAFVVSLHLQQGRGVSASVTGLFMLVANLGMPIAGPLSAHLSRFARPSSLMILSMAILAASLLMLALVAQLSLWLTLVPLLLFGLCAGVLYSIETMTVLDAIEGPQSARAMSALTLMRQIGSVLGIAALASVGQLAVSLGLAARGEQAALAVSAALLALIALRIAPRLRRLA